MKTLLITGASSGIGAATARAAAEAGWHVGLFARSEDKLRALAEEIGTPTTVLQGDVTRPADLDRAVGELRDATGRLDAAFANAGLGATASGTEGGDLGNWRAMVDVNIWGLLVTVKACMSALRDSRGHMVLTGSRAGRAELRGSVYGATKWFVHGYGQNLMVEMREWGGRCTVIAPGLVDTPFFEEAKPQGLRPEDVARAVMHALEAPPTVATGEVYLMPNPEGA